MDPLQILHSPKFIKKRIVFSKIKDFSSSGFGLRRLAIVELPLQKNSSSLDSIIDLVSVLLTFHELLRDNLMIIQSVDKKLVVDSCDEIIDMGDYKDPIPTSNTPRQSTNVKKKINAKGSS
ncbi:hypothetical protein C2G38_2230149 [Gigaspora rosea]|uniref:Uncharacterized protein n=1 Tax=Gigaspora rosea TaxID=44941 RepID=A0A397TW60_9GLOM|nr:hypothetical protein C2G38_2230149 [Gigaspora rosea]